MPVMPYSYALLVMPLVKPYSLTNVLCDSKCAAVAPSYLKLQQESFKNQTDQRHLREGLVLRPVEQYKYAMEKYSLGDWSFL